MTNLNVHNLSQAKMIENYEKLLEALKVESYNDAIVKISKIN